MPAVPRIARALPHGPITRPKKGIPVIARLHWASGQDTEVLAEAVAWTQDSVEVRWQFDDAWRSDWISAKDVRSRTEPPSEGA